MAITVKVSWEFYFDDEGFDEKFVDIEGLAIDDTKAEVKSMLENNEFTEEDFEYEIVKEDE